MVAAGGGQLREALERAFDIVPREYFLGPGPWLAVSSLSGVFVATSTDDPTHLYQNVLFALDRQKQINNGEPYNYWARWLQRRETWRFISGVGQDTTRLFPHI
jgi:protein-L-isoaspartate(D-aspartate) O-methyltransferase